MTRPGRPRKGERREPPPPRVCEHCGGAYTKPVIEPWGRWLARRFCSLDCYYQHKGSA